MSKIFRIWGDIIHDSRGDPTVQASVQTDNNTVGSAAIPAGASKGAFEASIVEASQAVKNITEFIEPVLRGLEVTDQRLIDQKMLDLDGTDNKSKLGANSILGVSMAAARAGAKTTEQELYRYIAALDDRKSFKLPIPMFNLINGGKHATNNLDIQEFMVVPDRVGGYHNQLSAGQLIFTTLGQILDADKINRTFGDEGGYAPNLDTNEMACDYLVRAIKDSGYKKWDEVSLALDVAASNVPPTFDMTPSRYLGFLQDFPILSLEDPFPEESWEDWSKFLLQMEKSIATDKKILLVGDDLYVTNPQRLQRGINEKSTNAVLVKLNQIGTVSETMTVIEMARAAGMVTIVSHRSGETLDDFIADFAVGMGAQFIKSGAPNEAHPERMTKYRRLLTIERQLLTPQ
ncbi:MAG: Enolase [Berkelbacteria bacterium GW2011_GWA2_46_7]|uniref:Enolase n=1 Tax=Berkelbacteria bacterium GW2011_GWA2_46_7 TaxID=1618335 RepID=A0A0G1QFB2_9BACT|nr:MAG: Enolase [Berkelbacteria bacterium GW2011_GWA2_46_7]